MMFPQSQPHVAIHAEARPGAAALREEDIRPAEMMQAKADCVQRDREYLLARRDRFVTVACPACDSLDLAPAFEKHGFNYEWCHTCGTLLMNPRADAALMHAFYASSANYAYWNEHIFPTTEAARREGLFRPRAERLTAICAAHGIRGGTLVEVGAGFGTFCEEVRRVGRFQRVVAVEPTPGLAGRCRSRGLETIEAPIEQCPLPDGCAAVVAAFEVIEHLFSPAEFITRAGRLLQPGGLLVLSCPNVLGFDLLTLGAASNTIDHEHVNYFHPRSMRVLLERCGMEVIEVNTPGRLDAELVRKAALAGRIDLGDQPFLKHVLIDAWDALGSAFQGFLAQHHLSGHMWAVACKST